jgi:hypothetical protein
MLRREDAGRLAGRIAVPVRVGKKPEQILRPEHAPYGLIHQRLPDDAVPHRARELIQVDGADHVHVHAGLQGEHTGGSAVGGDAVPLQLQHTGVVAHEHAVEAPGLPEHAADELAVRVHRHAGDLVERGHDGLHAGAYRASNGGR